MNAVAPGFTATQSVLNYYPDPQERSAMASKCHPMGRSIEPAEVADAVLWLVPPRASGVTGITVPVDGGWAAK